MRNQVLLPFVNAWLKAQGFSSAPESVLLNAIVFLCVITGDIISLAAVYHALDWELPIVSVVHNDTFQGRSIVAL